MKLNHWVLTFLQTGSTACFEFRHVCKSQHFIILGRSWMVTCRNHPVLKEDGILGVFLTVPSFEVWRKQASVSLDEESISKKVERVEEMSIPSDFEEKIKWAFDVVPLWPAGQSLIPFYLSVVRAKLGPLIEQWQRICILAERIMKRHETAAVRTPQAFRRSYLPTHFTLPNFSPVSTMSSSSSLPGSSSSNLSAPLNQSILGLRTSTVEGQSDLSRLTNTLRAVIEVNERCWRGDECDLSNGVRQGLDQLATHMQRHSDLSEARVGSFSFFFLVWTLSHFGFLDEDTFG